MKAQTSFFEFLVMLFQLFDYIEVVLMHCLRLGKLLLEFADCLLLVVKRL